MSKATIFKNITDTSTPFYKDVNEVLHRIQSGVSKSLIEDIRLEMDKGLRNDIKKRLPSICFSGYFTKRADSALVEHSGFICLDFDGYTDADPAKEEISKDPYVYSAFISPSGDGVKVLVKIPKEPESHELYFNALADHFNSDHFDITSKNLSRVCYESYDPDLYINEDSLVWDTKQEPERKEHRRTDKLITIPVTDEQRVVNILIDWWQKKYPMHEGTRNRNAYILAAAMNEFGVSQGYTESILAQYAEGGFKESEIRRTVESAYSKTENFNTKFFEDEERVSAVEDAVRKGKTKDTISAEMQDVSPEIISALADRVEAIDSGTVFWKKSKKGVVKIIHIALKRFLEDRGYGKYYPNGSKTYVFIRIKNNLILNTSEKEIKDEVMEYLLGLGDTDVYNYFAEHTKYFRESFLDILKTIDIKFVEDTKGSAYLYYKNCAVKVTKSGPEIIDYVDLDGYVWNDHVIGRDYAPLKKFSCDYSKFVSNISGSDEHRVNSMRSTIGYLMHGYKNLSFSPAVILNDEVISDNPEGGTGKGLFMNGVSKLKKLVFIDGKSFDFGKSFPYQTVSADTQILCFDDVVKNFDFEKLFSVVTEGITLEKKNKDAVKIPFQKSPKIAITTNYAIKGSGNSFARRKWELELHQYYTMDFTPRDEFGRMMFAEWSKEEWLKFDNYMIDCLKYYLTKGLVKSSFVNLRIRQLSAATSHDFIDWCGLVDGDEIRIPEGVKLRREELWVDFKSQNPDYKNLSQRRFNAWISSYAKFMGCDIEVIREMNVRFIVLRKKK